MKKKMFIIIGIILILIIGILGIYFLFKDNNSSPSFEIFKKEY